MFAVMVLKGALDKKKEVSNKRYYVPHSSLQKEVKRPLWGWNKKKKI